LKLIVIVIENGETKQTRWWRWLFSITLNYFHELTSNFPL